MKTKVGYWNILVYGKPGSKIIKYFYISVGVLLHLYNVPAGIGGRTINIFNSNWSDQDEIDFLLSSTENIIIVMVPPISSLGQRNLNILLYLNICCHFSPLPVNLLKKNN